MEMMNGAIIVESEKGMGATFYIDCPVGKQNTKTDSDSVEISLEDIDAAYNILYVEDNKSNQQLIQNLFETFPNLNLTIETSAEDGLRDVARHNYDLILMDINLPGMDGYDALKQLKLDAETKDIPIIAISASAGLNEIKKGIEAGFKQYITKPVMIPELISVINKELNRVAKH